MFFQFQKLARFFSCDIGIDLGTANFLVYMKDRGIVISEPSVVALEIKTNNIIAVGTEAKRMLSRVPKHIAAIRPMKYGVIADFKVTEDMLRYFIRKAKALVPTRKRLYKPRVLIAVPSGITEVERRAVKDSAERAGASDIFLVEEPMAAAIGVGLPVSEPCGSMIVDIGGGTTEVAIISLAGIVDSKSVRIGGDEMDQAIIQHMKRVYNLIIGEPTAEAIKIQIGSAYPVTEEETFMEVKGRDAFTSLPKAIKVSSKEIRIALHEPVNSIVGAIHSTLERCPPELAGDIMDHGIILAGGGAMLKGLDRRIQEDLQICAHVAEEPLKAVANGTGILLQEMDTMLHD